jgi:hypothetical protein
MVKFWYDPAEFVRYGGKLESYLVIKIQHLLTIVLDEEWRPIIDRTASQIIWVSEGCRYKPKIQFELLVQDGLYVARLLQAQHID